MATVDVAQDGVGREEDLCVAGTGHLSEGAGQLEATRDGGDVLVAGASGEVGGQADDVVIILFTGHDAVVAAGLEGLPLRVVGEVMVGVVLEVDQQGLGAVEHQDVVLVTEEGLPFCATLAPSGGPEGVEVTLGQGDFHREDRARTHVLSHYSMSMRFRALPRWAPEAFERHADVVGAHGVHLHG